MDAITIQILRNKIASLVDEMHYHFYRSGYSTIIRDSRDFSCVILDRTGRLIVAPPMFFHAPVYRYLVGRILELYGTDGIREGDVFVSNHPYEGGLPHVSDMAFVSPVFSGGEIVGFSGSIAHKADVGGTNPGSTSANATEMFHEGVLVPPIKIWDAGRHLPDVERLILANSRQPELVRGDMTAQIAVTQMGAERVQELCARFGKDTMKDAFAAILRGAAEELRSAIARLPDGESSAEGLIDNDGVDVDKPVKLAVTNYQQVNLKLVDVLLEAMAKFNPARANAHAGSSSALLIAWAKGRPGQSNMQYEIVGSAYGGGQGHDGASCTAAHLSNLHVTPIEILESEYPCRIRRFDIVPDTGGAGKWRGGVSFQREYELLEDAMVIRRFDKSKFPPGGVGGGKDGGGGRFIVRLGEADERETRASGRYEMKAGDRFMLQSAGGGGYGAPGERDIEALRKDVAEGYVTRDAAHAAYGKDI